MQTFEQIRAHLNANYPVRSSDPYLIGLDISLDQGQRRQSVFLTELEGDDGRTYVRITTSIAPITGLDARRALYFNWEQRVGHLSVSELDGVPYLQLCENRPLESLTAAEIDRIIIEIAGLGDRMERTFSAGGDLF